MRDSLENLEGLTTDELLEAFADTSSTVTQLDLMNCNLGMKSISEIVTILQAIPSSVKTLNLCNNNLNNKTGSELATAFATIPKSVTELCLHSNFLEWKTSVELASALTAIPNSVSTVHIELKNPSCLTRSGLEIARDLLKFQKGLGKYRFGLDKFWIATPAALTQDFATIPEEITSLNLAYHDLKTIPSSQLIKAFAALPQHIKELTLSLSDLGNLSSEELIDLGRTLQYVVRIKVLNGQQEINGSHKVMKRLKSHIGSWYRTAYQELQPLPQVIALEVLSNFASEEQPNEIKSLIQCKQRNHNQADCGFFNKSLLGALGVVTLASSFYLLGYI